MADSSVKVEVKGIKQLAAAFKDVDTNLPKSLAAAMKGIASQIVQEAQSKVPQISGKAAASIKPRGTARGASIAFGGTAAEYFPWLNFGGRVGRNKMTVRETVKPDRYVYATIAENREGIAGAVDNAIAEVSKEAGFETHE